MLTSSRLVIEVLSLPTRTYGMRVHRLTAGIVGWTDATPMRSRSFVIDQRHQNCADGIQHGCLIFYRPLLERTLHTHRYQKV